MLPVRVIGGPGKEVPPKESENELQEKGTVRAASELHEENAEPRTAMERIGRPPLEKS